jgi:DNA-binding transcriptional regulator YiaG
MVPQSIINPSGKWDFQQGKMPSGLRRWRVSANLVIQADHKERPPKLFDADGDDIKTIRNSLGWSTQRLADAAGINRNSVINLERPGKIPVRRAYAARRVEKAYQQAGFSFALRSKAGPERF